MAEKKARKTVKQASKSNASSAGPVSMRMFAVVAGIGLLVSGGTVLFAQTDAGVINVAGVINESNNRSEGTDGQQKKKQRAVNTRPTVKNGGLVGTGKPMPEPEPDVEGASTTEDGATTTPDGATSTPADTLGETNSAQSSTTDVGETE